MTTNTMGRDEAVEVLLGYSQQHGNPEDLDLAIAALQAQSSTEEWHGLAEAWRDVAIANAAVVNEIRDVVGLTGKPGNVVEAVRELAALQVQGEPVAWRFKDGDDWSYEDNPAWAKKYPDRYFPLYTHPAPQQPAPVAPVGVEGLLQRIDAAIERVTTGRAAMRIPADPTDPDLVLADARNWIKQAALAQQPAAVDRARFRKAPCYLCGYNGPGYFQSETHPCAALYHAAQPGGSDNDR